MTTDGQRADRAADRYKWVALTNTTLGVLVVTINSSIVIISLPAIFRGIRLNPLQPANVSYLLWILLGFLVVTSVLVVSFGRLGDSFGRVRLYNLGFAIFTACSIGLSLIFAPAVPRPWRSSCSESSKEWAAQCSSPTPPRSSPTPSRLTSGEWRSASTRSRRSPGRSSAWS